MRSRLAVAVLFGLLGASQAVAGVWTRTRRDGTVEMTNVPRPDGSGWRRVEGVPNTPPRAPSVQRPSAPARPRTGSSGGTVWTREGPGGTVEFTNMAPTGARWKVLFRTGPGKAAAERGVSDVVPPRDRTPARYGRFDEAIRDQQSFYGVPEALLRAVIKTESDYDPRVVSSAGAIGLMQLMPGTARMMGVTDIWDPRQNIMGGARYLQVLAKRFCRTPVRAEGIGSAFMCSPEEHVKIIAGYHAGPGAVEKYGGLPPYETTRHYVNMVLSRYEQYRRQDALLQASVRTP